MTSRSWLLVFAGFFSAMAWGDEVRCIPLPFDEEEFRTQVERLVESGEIPAEEYRPVPQSLCNLIPAGGYVRSERTAIAIAKAVLEDAYDYLDSSRLAFTASEAQGKWEIRGSVAGARSRTYIVVVSKATAEILRLWRE